MKAVVYDMANKSRNNNAKNNRTVTTVSNTKKSRTNEKQRSVKDGEQLPLEHVDTKPGFWHQMIPFFLAVAAILLTVCFIFTDECGIFGKWVTNIFYGLFSWVAWLVPVLLIYLAIFWKRDALKKSLKVKLFVTFLISVIMSMAVFYVSVLKNGGQVPMMNPEYIWNMAQKSNGFLFGGIMGCYPGWLIFVVFSTIGTPIVLVSALVVLMLLLFNVEPDRLWSAIKNIVVAIFAAIGHGFAKFFGMFKGKKKVENKIYINKPSTKEQRGLMEEIDQSVFEEAEKEEKNEKPSKAEKAVKNEKNAPDNKVKKAEIAKAIKGGGQSKPINSIAASYGVEEGDTEEEKHETVSDNSKGIDLDAIFTEDEKTTKVEGKKLSKKSLSVAKYGQYSSDIQTEEKTPVENRSDFGSSNEVNIDNYTSRDNSNVKIYGSDDPNDVELDDPDTLTIERVSLMTAVDAGGEIPAEEEKYTFPPIEYLQSKPEKNEEGDYESECRATGEKLVEALKSFRVNTRLVNISRGPTVTRYELAPDEGVRVKSIANLSDDIALNLAARGAVRIEAPIVGKAAVGVEIANSNRETVYLRELLENPAFKNAKSSLTTAVGLDVAGDPVYMDIAKMPHILIAGTTGSGKSVCINCIVMSLLYKASPDEVKLIMIDPKKVEFGIYNGLPHLIVPVVSNPKKSAGALVWAVNEMERRYDLIEEAGVRDIAGYNEITRDDPEKEFMPKLVIVIDELADLMMTAPDSVETSICRIAQKGRAAGMHLIIGTQRPSVDVITGLIKANVPSRIAFTVSSQIDSRTIIDISGAEKLIGRGDMLYSPIGSLKPTRLQGAFVSDGEVDRITEFIRENNKQIPYDDNILANIDCEAERCSSKSGKSKPSSASSNVDEAASGGEENALQDPKFNEAVKVAIESGKISTSFLQRRLSLGYGRAAKLIDAMEKLGIVSAPDGQRARNVLISQDEWNEMMMSRDDD